MRISLWIVGFALVAAGIAPAQDQPKPEGQDKYTLEWKFKKGDQFRYEMSMDSETTVAGFEISNDTSFAWSQECQEVSAENVGTMKVTYDRVKFKMSGGPMEMEFDSDKKKKEGDEDENPMSAIMEKTMGAIVGKSITMKLSKRGECLSVDGLDKIIADAKKKAEDDEDGEEGAPAMRGGMDGSQMKHMMQMNFGLLPKVPVAKGDSWDGEMKFGMPMMAMELQIKSTLKEVRERDGAKEAVIEMVMTKKKDEAKEGKDKKKDKDEDEEEGPMPGMGRLDVKEIKGKFEVIWNMDKGCLVSNKGSMTMGMSMGPQEMETTMNLKMKTLPPKAEEKPVEKK